MPEKTSQISVPKNLTNNNMHRIIVWFRNDLRVHDNPILDWAAKYNIKGLRKEVIPVFSFDPRFYKTKVEKYSSLKCGLVRARFITETV